MTTPSGGARSLSIESLGEGYVTSPREKASKSPLEVATEWLRGFANTYLPSDAALTYCPEMLRAAGVSIIGLVCFLCECRVVDLGEVDLSGARWTAEGVDCDGNELRVEVTVKTQEMSLKVDHLERVFGMDGSYDAA